MSDALITQKIEPNYDKPWVRGWEYIIQEGSSYIQKEREKRGWTREQVEEMTSEAWMWEPLGVHTQAIIEGEEGTNLPTVDQLVTYALLFNTSPGRLLDDMLESHGERLVRENGCTPVYEPHRPRVGDDVEKWLQRELVNCAGEPRRYLDILLAEYHDRALSNTPLLP